MDSMMAELNRRLASLQEAVADRDRQIAGLHEWVGSLHQALAQRDLQLGRLQDTITERERHLHRVEANLARTQLSSKALRSSISWKLTSPLRETRRLAIRIMRLFSRRQKRSGVGASANPDPALREIVAPQHTEPLLYSKPGTAVAQPGPAEENSLSEGEPV
jgi:uncharacterized coiled-coil protein SlyX